MPEITSMRKIDVRGLAAADIAVASTGVVYTDSFLMPSDADFAVFWQASTPGAVDIKIELEQGISRPATEGSADTDNFSVPLGAAEIEDNVTTEVFGCKAYAPVTLPYARFKLTGQGTNNAGSKFTKLGIYYVDKK